MPHIYCEVINRKGMHARAAAKVVSLVDQFDGQVTFQLEDRIAPANSLIKLLTLNAPQGSKIKITVSGKDEKPLIKALKQLFVEGFGE